MDQLILKYPQLTVKQICFDLTVYAMSTYPTNEEINERLRSSLQFINLKQHIKSCFKEYVADTLVETIHSDSIDKHTFLVHERMTIIVEALTKD